MNDLLKIEPETTIITLYKKGITTSEISNLIEKIYGHPYSPAMMSNISKAVADQLENFHKRQLSERYAVIFTDATYLNVRRDSVAKEPLHVLLGITPDGTRDYALYPTKAAANYEEMMESIKKRGVKQVLLFASDGLAGMRDAVKRQFPEAEHQQCWVHLSRTVARYIRNKDRKNVLDDLKSVYRTTSENEARKALAEFLAKYGKRYPKLAGIFERAEESLYPFTNFRRQAEKAFTLQI